MEFGAMQHANATVSLVENLYSFLARSKVRFFLLRYRDCITVWSEGFTPCMAKLLRLFVKAFAHYKEFIAFIVFRS